MENLQGELVKLREDLLGAMGQLEEERHRARTLQAMVTNTTTQEERQSVIRTLDREILWIQSGIRQWLGIAERRTGVQGITSIEDCIGSLLTIHTTHYLLVL